MTNKPIKLSEYLNIEPAKLSELGVFDPILNCDTKLFVDPLLLKDSASLIMQNAYLAYNLFFADLMKLLRLSSKAEDRCWRAAKRMVDFPEYKYTCIGYGTGTINGAGSGAALNDKILQSAKEIITLAENDPHIFLLLPLLEEGIGSDIISDMTQNIIDNYICEYTVDIMNKLNIVGTHKHMSKSNKIYYLPYNKYHNCPIKLLPLDILSNLPLAETFDSWLIELSQENQILRSKVNKLIGSSWLDATKKEKKETMLDLIKNDKDFFFAVLELLQVEDFEHYDLGTDVDGLYRWLEDSKYITKATTLSQNLQSKNIPLFEIVGLIIDDFKRLIETQELWRIFWTDIYKKHKHVKEFYSQMLFYMVSSSWVTAQGSQIIIDRVFNKESKQLEIIFTMPGQQRVKVQLKHSDNYAGLKKCYEDQVLQCDSKNIKCYYIVLDFMATRTKQLHHIISIKSEVCKIIEIDVAFKEIDSIEISNDLITLDFGELTTQYYDIDDDYYLNEKRRGGKSSYKRYWSLKKKVKDICRKELENNSYSSARLLCNVVANIIEVDYKELLMSFEPYKYSITSNFDWRYPTFYNWCNETFKGSSKAKL